MAQPLQSMTIAAPGFFGLNNQDSPVAQQPSFASIATNCVIDQFGRVGARKGYIYVTTTSTGLSSAGLSTLYEYITKATGASVVLSTGNNKIWTGTTTLTDVTPGAYTITEGDWKVVELNSHVYFFQRGYEPLVYSEATGTVVAMSSVPSALGTPPEGNEALAAFGKLWSADFETDKSTISWSDTLNGNAWTGGTSGSINLNNVWPAGNDEVVALREHNGFLVIFGRRSILIYAGADDPATMVIADAIQGVGCIARDSVQSTGADILFLAENGVISLGRLIQEKSVPLRDISKNVRSDIIRLTGEETGAIKSAYSAEEAFYLISFPTAGIVYCFDMRSALEDGSQRATKWDSIEPECFLVRRDGTLLLGHPDGMSLYDGYQDNGASYEMGYFSNPISFDNATTLKFLKKLAFTLIGGTGVAINFKWAYDYRDNYRTQAYTLSSTGVAAFNTDEYNVAEYTTGLIVTRPSVNSGGSGYVITIGLTSTINGSPLSIQQIDVLALLGRLI